MNKRLAAKTMLVLAVVGAMTLLQGCGGDEDDEIGAAWAPIGSMPLPWFAPMFGPGSTSTGQTTQPQTGGAVAGGTP